MAKKLTLDQLAERISALGHPTTLNTMSKIERNQRALDIDDVVLIARALEVPPLEIVLPLHLEKVEALPGVEAAPWVLGRWFEGSKPFGFWSPGPHHHTDPEVVSWRESDTQLFAEHDSLVAFLANSRKHLGTVKAGRADDASDPEGSIPGFWERELELTSKSVQVTLSALARLRGEMAHRGLPLPEINEEI